MNNRVILVSCKLQKTQIAFKKRQKIKVRWINLYCVKVKPHMVLTQQKLVSLQSIKPKVASFDFMRCLHFVVSWWDMNERKRMIIKALIVSRKYKLTEFDKLCLFLFKEWKYRKEYQCVNTTNADTDRQDGCCITTVVYDT